MTDIEFILETMVKVGEPLNKDPTGESSRYRSL